MAGGSVTGRAAIAELHERWFKAFPDIQQTFEEPLIDGDRVVQTILSEGTDRGEFLGLPPTGKPFHIRIVLPPPSRSSNRPRTAHLRLHRHARPNRRFESEARVNHDAMSADAAPRLLVTDTLGRRMIPVDKPLLTLGRRSETDIRVPGAGISAARGDRDRELGEPAPRLSVEVRDVQSTASASPACAGHGDQIRLGQQDHTEIVFCIGDEAPSQERSAVAAASELRHMAGLLEGLRGLGSGRVVDDVLQLVIDSAIDVTGAERGFIMLANDQGSLEFKLARARGRLTLSGHTFAASRKIPETVFTTGQEAIVEDLLDGDLAHLHTGHGGAWHQTRPVRPAAVRPVFRA